MRKVEWPTVALIVGCYAAWLALLAAAGWLPVIVLVPALALTITLHSSLTHEICHGHPTRDPAVNEAFAFTPLGLFIPFRRFRDIHLAHHKTPALTDPYDDPESFYLPLDRWRRLARPIRFLLTVNNTLAGRCVIGPALALIAFFTDEVRRLAHGERRVIGAWLRHAAGLMVVGAIVWLSGVGALVYLLAAYLGMSVLMVRTYLEHQADEDPDQRTVIIEDRGLLSWLFLNNNLHAVHHANPSAAWYRLPALYARDRSAVLERNGDYRYASYMEIFRRYAVRTKEPVVHPLDRAS